MIDKPGILINSGNFCQNKTTLVCDKLITVKNPRLYVPAVLYVLVFVV